MIGFCIGAMNVIIGLDGLITHYPYAWLLIAMGAFLMVTSWIE